MVAMLLVSSLITLAMSALDGSAMGGEEEAVDWVGVVGGVVVAGGGGGGAAEDEERLESDTRLTRASTPNNGGPWLRRL